MRAKRSQNVKYFFHKNNAEKNGTFHMQIMLNSGNKDARIICDTCKLSIRHKNSASYFHFEQLSIIPVVFLLLNFNKYAASGVLSFSIHQNVICGGKHKCASEHLGRNKQKISTGKKTIEEKQVTLLESM